MRAAAYFRPRLVPTLAALAGALITGLLGSWQLERAAEKAQLQARVDQAGSQEAVPMGVAQLEPASVGYRMVEASGTFKADATVYVDNRTRNGVPGYEIVTPLRIGDSAHYVLVKRGWVEAGASRGQLPLIVTPGGTVTVRGIALPGNPRLFELSGRVQLGPLWENITVDRYREAYGLELQPVIIQQANDTGDGLARDWRRPDTGVNRHRAYALQWFTLCITIVVIYVVLNVRAARHRQRAA
jgi:surfeit locus 1 family protein